MRLSGHKYDNAVFDSLLDGLKNDIVVNKAPMKKEASSVSGLDVFSATTDEDMRSIHDDELRVIASELQFAADRARVELSPQDLVAFATKVNQESLRGKSLERAAQKFCSKINRGVAAPQSSMRVSEAIDNGSIHGILPSGFPDDSINNSKTGGYLGMSKNPNTIWDSEALHQLASVPQDYSDKHGDEQIKTSREARKEYKKSQKDIYWKEIQDKMSDELMIRNKIANVSTGEEVGTSQKLPTNAMSMFDTNRDFENIPEKTAGEMLREAKEKRSTKADVRETTSPVKKSDNAGNFLFQDEKNAAQHSSSQRAAIDRIFEAFSK